MKNTVRTFIAVETSEAVRHRAAELIAKFAATGVKVSWAQEHNMHLTLKFLDEVPLDSIPQVSAAVAKAATGFEAFELEIRGAGLSQPRPAENIVAGHERGQRIAGQAARRPGKGTESLGLPQGASPLRGTPDHRPSARS